MPCFKIALKSQLKTVVFSLLLNSELPLVHDPSALDAEIIAVHIPLAWLRKQANYFVVLATNREAIARLICKFSLLGLNSVIFFFID